MHNRRQVNKSRGFTLLEVMMVIVLLGFMASVVQFSVLGNTPEDRLEKESERFLAVFNLAADFALLNNLDKMFQNTIFLSQLWRLCGYRELHFNGN